MPIQFREQQPSLPFFRSEETVGTCLCRVCASNVFIPVLSFTGSVTWMKPLLSSFLVLVKRPNRVQMVLASLIPAVVPEVHGMSYPVYNGKAGAAANAFTSCRAFWAPCTKGLRTGEEICAG